MNGSGSQQNISDAAWGWGDQDVMLYLSKGARLEGACRVRGGALIDGHVAGKIHTDSLLTISREAVVEADIWAQRLIAQGPIRGDVHVEEGLQLLAPAVVEGAMHAPRVSLEDGVQVRGRLMMDPHGRAVAEAAE